MWCWPKCYHLLNWFFFSKLDFLKFIWFLVTKIIFKSMFPTFWIQILSNKFHEILFIKIFPTKPKGHSNAFKIFHYNFILFWIRKSFDIQKLLHQKSKHHGTKPMHPSSSKIFQSCKEHELKHLGLMDFIITKQNKLLSFIDRLFVYVY